ncbi:MAG: hypothetical protein WC619_04170 [Patescibacteria group bacterium]
MKKVGATCSKCKQPWEKKLPAEGKEWEDEFGGIIFDSTSDLCHACTLLLIFRKNPKDVTAAIRRKQEAEKNSQCFNTGEEECSKIDCLWKIICPSVSANKEAVPS